jgi:hypothetical protein
VQLENKAVADHLLTTPTHSKNILDDGATPAAI